MPEALNTIEILRDNLIDAGYTNAQAECFMKCFLSKDWDEIQRIILKQRNMLLHSLHQTRNQIDCLDYLLYQIKKEKL